MCLIRTWIKNESMKRRILFISAYSLLLFIAISGCNQPNTQRKELTIADSTWSRFKQALVESDMNYLMLNSKDSILCVDCLSDSLKNEEEIYSAKYIFENHLVKLKHFENVEKHKFNTYHNDTVLYISYSIKWKYAEEGWYDLHYRFEKQEEDYLFSGMFTTP